MGSGRCSARSTAIARAMIASLLVRGFGLSMRQPRRECFATVFAACCASSASSGSVSRRSTIAACRRRRGNHPHVGLWKLDAEHALALEFLRGLAEAPRVERDLAQPVAGGEVADLLDAFEDAAGAAVDRDADVQAAVDPDDGGRAAFAANVYAGPDRFAVLELGFANAGLPRARGEQLLDRDHDHRWRTCSDAPRRLVPAPTSSCRMPNALATAIHAEHNGHDDVRLASFDKAVLSWHAELHPN